MLGLLRAALPQVEVVLSGHVSDLTPYAAVFAMNVLKNPLEESALERSGRPLVFANPLLTSATPLGARFTAAARKPLNDPGRGPANEYVAVTRKVDVDLSRFPLVQYRFRNSPGALFHIRYYGLDRQGNEVQAWYEGGPTEHRATRGQWLADQANVAEVTRHVLKEPLSRLSRIEVILDDMEDNGTFTLEMDYLRFSSPAGEVGLSVALDPAQGLDGSFRFRTSARRPSAVWFHHGRGGGPVDPSHHAHSRRERESRAADRRIDLPDRSERRGRAAGRGHRGRQPGSRAPGPRWDLLAQHLHPVQRVLGGADSPTDEGRLEPRGHLPEHVPLGQSGWGDVGDERRSDDHPRRALAHRPRATGRAAGTGACMPHALPVDPRQPSLRVVQGARSSIPLPDARGGRATIMLEPGEVVDLLYPEKASR